MYKFVDRFLMNDFSKDIVENIKKTNKKIIVLDVGCYLGNFSRRLLEEFDNKNIPSNFILFDANPNLKIDDFSYHKIAFSNTKSEKEFFLNNLIPSSGSSLKDLVINDSLWNFSRRLVMFSRKNFFTTIKVVTETLDNFCKKDGIKSIDVLKIDVEGSEFDILKGANKTLKHTNILQLEILEKKNKFQSKYDSLIKFLESGYGFRILKKKNVYSTSIFSDLKCVDILLKKN